MWKKLKIANGALAVVAVALSVVAFYVPNLVYVAMWAWTFALWMFVELVATPIINANRQKYNLLANSLFLSPFHWLFLLIYGWEITILLLTVLVAEYWFMQYPMLSLHL